MTKLIHNNTSIGINLNPSYYTSPVIIEAGITVSNPEYPAVVYTDPNSPARFRIQNHGSILGSGSSIGIYLSAGGRVVNEASGVISAFDGVNIEHGRGNVINEGTILGGRYGVYLDAGIVTNAATGLMYINGGLGVEVTSGPGTVINDGTMLSTGYGVRLVEGGIVVNKGYIETGVEVDNAAGTVINYGTMGGSGVFGSYPDGSIYLFGAAGGVVINSDSASISGFFTGISMGAGSVTNDGVITAGAVDFGGQELGWGILIGPGPGSVYNGVSGVIKATSYGIYGYVSTTVNDGYIKGNDGIFASARGPCLVINNATGTIVGNAFGVDLVDGGTLSNGGTIIASFGTAAYFGGANSNRLVLTPGSYIAGIVGADPSANNTIELAPGAVTGTVIGIGTQIIDFNSIVFDSGAKWSVAGVSRGLDAPISGFASGDMIDLENVKANSYTYSAGHLSLFELEKQVQTLSITTQYGNGSQFTLKPDGGGGTLITVAPSASAASTFTFQDIQSNGTAYTQQPDTSASGQLPQATPGLYAAPPSAVPTYLGSQQAVSNVAVVHTLIPDIS